MYILIIAVVELSFSNMNYHWKEHVEKNIKTNFFQYN